MKMRSKKMIMGIAAGLVLTVGGIGYAAQNADANRHHPHHMNQGMPGHMKMEPEKAAKQMAQQFGLEESEILAALKDNRDFRDVGQAAMLAKVSGKSFSDVLAMKQDGKDWQEVTKTLGVTKEQIHDTMNSMMTDGIATEGKTDRATVEKLMGEGYNPWDIMSAGKLANASGKDIQSVLGMKKINNQWKDVAKDLGVDENLLKPDWSKGPGFGGPMGGPGPMMGGPGGPVPMMGGPGPEMGAPEAAE